MTRHARGTRSTADWQLYKHLTAVCSHSQPHFSYVRVCPVDAPIPACQEPSFSAQSLLEVPARRVSVSACVGVRQFHFHLTGFISLSSFTSVCVLLKEKKSEWKWNRKVKDLKMQCPIVSISCVKLLLHQLTSISIMGILILIKAFARQTQTAERIRARPVHTLSLKLEQ